MGLPVSPSDAKRQSLRQETLLTHFQPLARGGGLEDLIQRQREMIKYHESGMNTPVSVGLFGVRNLTHGHSRLLAGASRPQDFN